MQNEKMWRIDAGIEYSDPVWHRRLFKGSI